MHFDALLAHAQGIRGVSTHAHHLPSAHFTDYSLDKLLEDAYVSWYKQPITDRSLYFDQVRNTTYFLWLERALQAMYQIDQKLTPATWPVYDAALRAAYKAPGAGVSAMERLYGGVILDAYWQPGDDNGHPSLFRPTFRVNMFFYGYDKKAKDHNGNNAQLYYGVDIKDLDEYVAFVQGKVLAMKMRGCVALKSALAYDRPLDFGPPHRDRAARVFREASEENVGAFQDYLFDQVCKVAAREGLPFQNHTGLGRLDRTRALSLLGAIDRNPDTQFVLFHGGYPWTDDILALTHNYGNVYPDLCWLPILSSQRAERFVNELMDVALSDRICWGCDTWTAEESQGALMAAHHVLSKALSNRIDQGYLDEEEAKRLLTNILSANAKKLYNL